MSDVFTILFYDGYRAGPKECRVELMPGNCIGIYDMDHDEGSSLIFDAGDSHISFLGEKAFVHLERNGGPYFELSRLNALYPAIAEMIGDGKKDFFSRLIKQKWPVLVAMFGALVIVAWLLIAIALPPVIMKFISVNKEIALGNRIYSSFIDGKEEDMASSRLVQEFANRLSLSRKYPVRISVIKDKDVNAFALPGGRIIVYTGILEVLETPEQLAALLGHEATHVNERHTLRMLLSTAGFNLVRSILLGGFGNGDMLIGNLGMLTQRSYSRSLERQADKEGMKLMVSNRIDPGGMKELMEQLQKAHSDIPGMLSFISTHPLTADRIKYANEFIAEHKSGTFAPDLSLDVLWKALKSLHEAKTSTSGHAALP